MDFISILQTVKEYIPIPVIVAVIAVIMLVYGSSLFLLFLKHFLKSHGTDRLSFSTIKKYGCL